MACVAFVNLAFEWCFAFMTDLAGPLCNRALDISSCTTRSSDFFRFEFLLRARESRTLPASLVIAIEAHGVHAILRLAVVACAMYSDPDGFLDPVDVTLDRRLPITNF